MVQKKKEFTEAQKKAHDKYIEKGVLDKKFPHDKVFNEIKRIGIITAAAGAMLSALVAFGKKTHSNEDEFYMEQEYHFSHKFDGLTIEDVRENQKGLQAHEFYIILSACAILAILYNLIDKKVYKKSQEAVNLMLELQDKTKRFNVDVKQLKKLTNVVPDVFKNMTADTRVYFDLLLSGDFPLDDNGKSLQLATMVMSEHLRKHPKDYELLLSAFDEKSLPKSIVEEYGKKKSR